MPSEKWQPTCPCLPPYSSRKSIGKYLVRRSAKFPGASLTPRTASGRNHAACNGFTRALISSRLPRVAFSRSKWLWRLSQKPAEFPKIEGEGQSGLGGDGPLALEDVRDSGTRHARFLCEPVGRDAPWLQKFRGENLAGCDLPVSGIKLAFGGGFHGQWQSSISTSSAPWSEQRKHKRYCWLMWMLNWPFRSPVRASRAIAGRTLEVVEIGCSMQHEQLGLRPAADIRGDTTGRQPMEEFLI